MILKIIGGIALVGALVATVSCKRHAWCAADGQKKMDWMAKKAKKKLDLNESQEQSLQLLLQKGFAVKSQLKAGHDKSQVIEQILSNELDQSKITDAIDKRLKIVETNSKELVSLAADFHKSLSQEQKEKLAGFMNKKKCHH